MQDIFPKFSRYQFAISTSRLDTGGTMKRQLTLLGMLTVTVSSFGQGLINFINYDPWNNVNGQLTRSDGTLAGLEFLGQLYAAPAGGSLEPVGVPVMFIANGILSGRTVQVPFVEVGAMADVQLRSWCAAQGPSYEAAIQNPNGLIAESNVISITLGGGSMCLLR